jgi:hypothetical protein
VVEKAEENAAINTAKANKTPSLTTQQVNNAQKATQKAAAKDLKPALAVAEQAVADLESAAAGLEAALSVRKSASSIENAGSLDDENPANSDTRLAVLRAAGLEALQAVRESRLALAEAQQTLKLRKGSSGGVVIDSGDTILDTVLRKVVAAATSASRKVDETMAAVAVAEEEQREEVADIVVKLGEQKRVNAEENADESPRPPVDNLNRNNGEVEEKEIVDESTKTEATANKLLEDDLHAGREVNATLIAQAAADAAEDIVQIAKEAAEQAVGKAKKVDVAVRAIEIAKELASSSKVSSGGGAMLNINKAVEEIDGAEKSLETDDSEFDGGDTLLGNLTAVAEAVAGKQDDVVVAVEASLSGKKSRKLDPAG